MADIVGMLKTTEASVVARVPLRDVNRVIDEGILPNDFFTVENGRHVLPAACTLISFYFASARRLTAEERLHAIKATAPRLRGPKSLMPPPLIEEDWIVRDEFLSIDLTSFVKSTSERLRRLLAAREIVESSADILGGAPVVRGTRIPVHDVAASVATGRSIAQILAAYPSLDAEKVELAALYAEANPARGRPRGVDDLPKGAVIISDRRMPRRGTAG